MPTHVALLRGVNVGGRKLAMADLREILSSLGHTEVSTYIQSGNALFTPTAPADTAKLAGQLEQAITERLGMAVGVVVLSRDELTALIRDNPYPAEPNPKNLHAVVRSGPLGPELLERIAATAATVAATGSRDTFQNRGRVLYLHTPDGFGRSDLAQRLTRLMSSAKSDVVATARNWSTINKLLGLLDTNSSNPRSANPR
jgi:uncharacterized protein (DUF1697 family)